MRDAANTEIVRSYSYPVALEIEVNPVTNERYAVGDTVQQFAPLVEGVEILDYISDPTWFNGILQQGVFTEVQKFHTFSVRVDANVFDLSALLLVRNFVLQLRPTYTFPAVVVALNVEETNLSISDQIRIRGRLFLSEEPCSAIGSTVFDDPNPTGVEQYWNQFDDNEDTVPPTYPVADVGIKWGFDKQYLCPADSLVVNLTYEQVASGPALFDTFLVFDDTLVQGITYNATSPIVVPAFPGTFDIPVVGSDTAIFDGDLRTVRLLVVGVGPGPFATDYEMVVQVNGADTAVVPFDATASVFEVNADITGPLLLNDTVTVKIRIPAASPSPGARSPFWNSATALVTVEDGTWIFGDTVSAGTYYISIPL